MIVLASGPMKSGTHMLQRALQLAGVDSIHGHWPHGEAPPSDRHVHIVRRERRNCLVSMLRFRSIPISEATLIEGLRDYAHGMTMATYFAQFDGYLDDPDVFLVHYEDMLRTRDPLRLMCAYIGVDYPADLFERLPFEQTPTRNDRPSHWPDVWTPAVEAVWQEAMGDG